MKVLEKEKYLALLKAGGDYQIIMQLKQELQDDLLMAIQYFT